MTTEIEKYRLLGTPESIADRLRTATCTNGLIDRFEGSFSFLRNFQTCTVAWEGVTYKSVEAAFQAAKCAEPDERDKFRDCSPSEAKKMGRRCKLRPDWEYLKLGVMETLVWQKFQNNPDLRKLLLETGEAELVEGNRWHDNFWGDCKCPKCASIKGENRLGIILMNVRSKLRHIQEQMLSFELPDGTILRAMKTKRGKIFMVKEKKDAMFSVQKATLMQAVENTYEDSQFLVGRGIFDDCDFTRGLDRNRTKYISRDALLEEIRACKYDRINSIPEIPDHLVLDPKIYLFSQCISDNRIYHTDAPDGYYHLVNGFNPHFEVYIKVDRENMIISFLLGDYRKTLSLEIRPEHAYKMQKTKLYCKSVDDLEELIKDELWNPSFIIMGREALGINEFRLP